MRGIASGVVIFALGMMSAGDLLAQGLLQRLQGGIQRALKPPTPDDQPLTPRTDDALAPGYLGLVADEPRDGDPGPRVLIVRPGSPAEAAGIRVDDVIMSVDGVAMRSLDDMDRMLSKVIAGQTLRMVTERGGVERTVMPKLAAKAVARRVEPFDPTQPPVVEIEEGPDLRAPGRATLGVSVSPITEEIQRQNRLTTRRGAFVTNVIPGSPAALARIPIGCVIVSIDGRRLDTSDDLIDMVRQGRPGQEMEITYYQGEQLSRKVVRLGEGADVAVREQPIPSPGPAAPGERPLLKRLEGVLEGGLPARIIGQGANPGGPGVADDAVTLRRQVEEMQAHINRLEARLQELERRARP